MQRQGVVPAAAWLTNPPQDDGAQAAAFTWLCPEALAGNSEGSDATRWGRGSTGTVL